MTACPTVSIVIPVLDGAASIRACLEAVESQTYPRIVETLVVDGGSEDGTPEIAASCGARVVANPRRIQAAALNIGIEQARGDVVVRVDTRTLIEPDYVQASVAALLESGAAMVGGAQVPVSSGSPMTRGIALAMRSRFGSGTAAFRDPGRSGWVDTVYLGAYWRDKCRAVGGYDEGKPTNEDAELALRLKPHGGVWLDERIQSSYVPRSSVRALANQYYLYGRGRAQTARQYPTSIRPRQLAPIVLVMGLLSPVRRAVLVAYGVGALIAYRRSVRVDFRGTAVAFAATPVMHVSWAVGFLRSLVGR